MKKQFSLWPSFTEEEVEAVSNVLLSNKVNYWSGQEGRNFEKEFAEFSGATYAIAVSNGTVALDLALIALNIGEGDEVVVTSRTFLASVSSIVNCGAIPVFADVDKNSQNITANTIKKVLTDKTKAIVCVHLSGMPCEMDDIIAIAEKFDLVIIEDCAQAHGAKYKGRSVGSIGDIGCWSFCQDKIMTTGGEGGMVTTNNKKFWSKMWSYKDHGKSWESVYDTDHPPGFRWLHNSFGTNWRLTEMQSAIGRIQLKRMKNWTSKRQLNAKKIWDCASEFKSLRVPNVGNHLEHAFYKCYVFVNQEELKLNWNRDKIMNEILAAGVPCFSGSCSEVYLEKAFDDTKYRPKHRLAIAKELGETSLMFLVHPTLTKKNISDTVSVLHQVMTLATK